MKEGTTPGHTLLASFMLEKNKFKKPWEVRKKKGTELYPAAAQWCKVAELRSQLILEKLFSSQDAPSILILQCCSCKPNVAISVEIFGLAQMQQPPPIATTKVSLPGESLGQHCIQSIFQQDYLDLG